MIACPQCKEPINGIDRESYAVGWCQQDVHQACLLLHIRTCPQCRKHNEDVVGHVTT